MGGCLWPFCELSPRDIDLFKQGRDGNCFNQGALLSQQSVKLGEGTLYAFCDFWSGFYQRLFVIFIISLLASIDFLSELMQF